jgi:3-phosphoshikimate 1-carboxyvinyltransferase
VVGDLEPVGAFGAEEPVADLDVCYGPLEGTVVEAEEVPLAIDELPLVALLGCFAEGETVVRGASELRSRSPTGSPRSSRGWPDSAPTSRRPTTASWSAAPAACAAGALDARGDHRLAMLGAVAGLASREGVEVIGMEAAAVSYPGFADDVAGSR